MATNLVRFDMDGATRWGVVSESGVSPLAGDYPDDGGADRAGHSRLARRERASGELSLDSIKILSPVTAPCRIYCQGANYRQHMIESGMDPDAKLFNMFFTKSDASIASARDRVTRPKHVALLDYEIELALVFRRTIDKPVAVTRETLKDYVFGDRDRQRSQRPRRAVAADAVLQGKELSRLLSLGPVADGPRGR